MLVKNVTAVTFIVAALAACASAASSNVNTANAEAVSAEMSERSQKTLARFEPTGETQTCIPIRNLRTIKALSDDVLLVRSGSGTYYINRPQSSCNNAGSQKNTLSYRIDGATRLCAGEIVKITTRTSPSLLIGSCALGQFEAVNEKKP